MMPPDMMAPPPDMGGAGPAPAGPAPAGPGGEEAGPQEAPASLEDAASQALQILNSALAQADNDPEEANFAEAATSALTKILAANQKNSDAAMGIGPAHKAVRKATKKQSQGSQGGY
jgi:hypothetical protein